MGGLRRPPGHAVHARGDPARLRRDHPIPDVDEGQRPRGVRPRPAAEDRGAEFRRRPASRVHRRDRGHPQALRRAGHVLRSRPQPGQAGAGWQGRPVAAGQRQPQPDGAGLHRRQPQPDPRAAVQGNRRRAAQPDPGHRPHAARSRRQACAAVPLPIRRAQRRGHADPRRGRAEVGDVERGFAGLGRPGAGVDRTARARAGRPRAARHPAVPRHPRTHGQGAAADPGPAQRRRLPVRRLERARLQRGARGQQRRRTGGDQRLRQVVGHRHRHRRLRALAQAAVRGQRCAGHRADADRQLRFPVVAGDRAEEPGGDPQQHPGRFPRSPRTRRRRQERPRVRVLRRPRRDPQAGLRARPGLHHPGRLGPGAVRHRRDSDDRDPGHCRKPGSQACAVRDGRVLQRPGPDPRRRYQRLPARERAAHRPADAHRRRRRPAGRRQRPQWPFGVHLGAVAGAVGQGRPQWRRPDHRHRAGRLRGAGGVEHLAADARVRQPARFAGW
ncbi:hypothetical protein NB706_002800 [Xanthomonas sacchari]|nr:hypothetical protein [Xanthomonas sacchari]